MQNIYEDKRVSVFVMLFLITGVLCGSLLYLYLFIRNPAIGDSGLSQYSILGLSDVSNKEIAIVILRRRILQSIFIIILFYIFRYSFVLYGCGSLFGTYYGYSMCQMFCRFGVKGAIYNLICFFPHYLCYGISIFMFAKLYNNLFQKKIERDAYVKKSQYFIVFLVIIFFLFLGLFWEIKFQKNILIYFNQYLVLKYYVNTPFGGK